MDRLFPGITAEGHRQAALGAAVGGLGWRSAVKTVLPANLAALVLVAPMVRSMAASASRAGLLRPGQLEGRLDEQLRTVRASYLGELDEVEKVKAEEFLERGGSAASLQWRTTVGGEVGARPVAPRADATYAGLDEHHPVPIRTDSDEGSSDAEGAGRRLTAVHLQRELCRLQDCTSLGALEATLAEQGNWPQLDRLRELRHPEVSHR